jgi:formyltetrahydrofolate synthetase
LKNIKEIADKAGIKEEELELYGNTKAKVKLDVIERLKDEKNGKYILVTAITPTPLGEGKTTTLLGLTQAFGTVHNKNVIACIRQPSMAPTFNIKGGGAGGGKSLAVPVDEINLGLTGDIHAIGAAHNLAMAALDTRMWHETRQSDEALKSRGIDRRLDIDPDSIIWNRVVDVCDRSLRGISVGLHDNTVKDGSPNPVFPRKTNYDLTVASELMAILALATDLKDLRERIGKAVIALDKSGDPVTLEDLRVAGAVAAILIDAIKPTLVQTSEGQPTLVHTGPFANIAHGNSSIVADKIALKLADYVITEAGFAADMGMEKFFNIKCRYSGLSPDAVVMVATVRALKLHGGGPAVRPGNLDEVYTTENLELLEKGLENLGAHIRNAKKYGVEVVVAINQFPEDTEAEIEMIRKYSMENGALDAVGATHFSDGGPGAGKLAAAVIKAAETKSEFNFLYDLEDSIEQKIETIATKMYGADGVDFSDKAKEQIEKYTNLGFDKIPICMAKTPLSLSHDPSLKGVPSGFRVPIKEIRASVGAGFLYPLTGDVSTMPGLATRPSFMDIDINTETGEVVGVEH